MTRPMNETVKQLIVFFVLGAVFLSGCGGSRAEGQDPSNGDEVLPARTSTPTLPGAATTAAATAIPDRELYLGLPAPGNTPEVFLPGLVSTEGIELFFALHPNREEVYFTRVAGGRSIIMVTFLKGGEWSEPVPAAFSSDFQDAGPFITADGEQLYFWSNRPLTPTTPLMPYFQIWVVEREGAGWGEPQDLVMPLESRDGEWDVSVTAAGTLYYMADYPSLGGKGLFRTEEVDGVYQMPEKVPVLSNQEGLIELEPVVSPDERFILFYSVGREDNLTPDGRVGDLYISVRQPSGSWSDPKNLGTPVNSQAEEATPSLSPDGRFLFFATNRDAPTNFPDIYWVSIEVLEELLEEE